LKPFEGELRQKFGGELSTWSRYKHVLAHHINSRAYATILHPSVVCLLSVTYVVWLNGASELKLLLTAYRKS